MYIYERQQEGGGYELIQRIAPFEISSGDQFGFSVDVDATGDRIVIGANRDDDNGRVVDGGTVYVFVRRRSSSSPSNAKAGSEEDEVFELEQQILASDGSIGDLFGNSVCIDGNRIAVGAKGRSENAGKVYLFQRRDDENEDSDGSGLLWAEVGNLLPPDPEADGSSSDREFGSVVALEGDALMVGSHLDDTSVGEDSGSVYSFDVCV